MSITIYSTSTCTACEALTAWLKSKNLEYTKKITDADAAVMAEFMSVNDGMIGVPFTIVKDDAGAEHKISGFDQGEFKQALGIS